MTGSVMSIFSIQPITAVAWAATFLLHSTLLIGCTWLLTRLLGMRGLIVQDKLWKVALTGALFSCTVQTGLGDGSIAPRIVLPTVSLSAAIPLNEHLIPAAAADGTSDHRWPPPAVTGRSLPDPAGFPESDALRATMARTGAAPGEQGRRLLPLHWQWFFLLLWGVGAAWCTGGLARQLIRLKRRFRDRREITSGPLHRIFSDLVASRYKRSGAVRLTVSHRIPVPVACGIRRPEICLPGSMARVTAPEQLRSVLAHELAHIVRRDQVWLLLARLVEGIFFFQPLVRLARRCFQETAEFICDGEAVRQTGERVPLARTLHEMALRQVSTTTVQTMPGISGKGSPLNRRIEMILDKNRPAASRAHWFGPLAVVLILTFAFLAPGVAVGDDPPPRPDEVLVEEAPPAPAAPDADRQAAREVNLPAPKAPWPGYDGVAPEPSPPVPPAKFPSTLDAPVPDAAAEPPAPVPQAWYGEGAGETEDAAAADVERGMAAEEAAMREAELEMAAEEATMREAELEMAAEEEAMREAELEMAAEEEAMQEAERKMAAEEEAMIEMQRELEFMAQELAAHQLDLARSEHELVETEEALARDLEALEMDETGSEDEAGSAGGVSKEEARAREEEIRRRHREIRERHREITRQHSEISRQHRDAARRQAELLRQRRAESHAAETAEEAQRRGLERALRGIEKSMDGELTDEQRDHLAAIRSDVEVKLELLDQQEALERTVISDETVPRPEELD